MIDLNTTSLEGRTSSHLMFLLLDCVETLQMVAEKEFAKNGLGLKPRQKALLNSIKYSVKDLRKTTLLTDLKFQAAFGEDAEFLFKIIMLVVDRVGKDPEKTKDLLEFLCGMSSTMSLNLNKFGVRT